MGVEGAVSRETKKVRAKAGDWLPHVGLRSTGEREVELPEAAKTSHLVLFFYPGDLEGIRYPELAGCTPEACAFRDNIQRIRELGAEVFGVNFHATERQRSFVEREHLSFELLSDHKKELATALGVPTWKTNAGEEFVDRVTIIVEAGGTIRHVFEDVQVEGQVLEVMDILESLR